MTTWSSLTKNSLPPFIVTSDSPRSPTPSPERTLTSQPALDMVSKPGLSPVLSTDVHLPTEAETPHPITPRIPLKLISHISSGRLSDVFQATLSTHQSSSSSSTSNPSPLPVSRTSTTFRPPKQP